jgi:hypothetical protein
MAPGPAGQVHPLPDDKALRLEMLRVATNYQRLYDMYNFDFDPEPGSVQYRIDARIQVGAATHLPSTFRAPSTHLPCTCVCDLGRGSVHTKVCSSPSKDHSNPVANAPLCPYRCQLTAGMHPPSPPLAPSCPQRAHELKLSQLARVEEDVDEMLAAEGGGGGAQALATVAEAAAPSSSGSGQPQQPQQPQQQLPRGPGLFGLSSPPAPFGSMSVGMGRAARVLMDVMTQGGHRACRTSTPAARRRQQQ